MGNFVTNLARCSFDYDNCNGNDLISARVSNTAVVGVIAVNEL